jgi:MFS family permease
VLAGLFSRRRVMIACALLRIVTVGLMAIPGMPFAALYVLLFCAVLTGAPFSSVRAALLPDVLPGEQVRARLGDRQHQLPGEPRSWGSSRARRWSP